MADLGETAAPEGIPKRGKSKLIIIVSVALVLIVTMVAAFLILRGGEDGPPPVDSFLVSIPDMTVMLPDGVYILVVGVTLEISPLKERGFNKTDAKQELALWSEDTADTTRMPLVRETIGMVLASKTKEEWTMEIVKNQIKTKIMNELNGKVLKKCRVRQVIFSTPPLIQ